MVAKEAEKLIGLMKKNLISKQEMLEYVKRISANVPEFDTPPWNEGLYYELIFRDDILGYAVSQGYCDADVLIDIPENYRGLPVICIPEAAFENCTNLLEMYLPDTLLYVDDFAFSQCHNLKSLVIHNNVKQIGTAAFESCLALETLVLSNSLEYIGEDALNGCESLTSIEIPASLLKVPEAVCMGCKNLKQAWLYDGLKAIKWAAFSRCSSLRTIRIPASIEKIESGAFSECYDLKVIKYQSTYESWLKIEKDSKWNLDMPECRLECTDQTITLNAGPKYVGTAEHMERQLSINPPKIIKDQIIKNYLDLDFD